MTIKVFEDDDAAGGFAFLHLGYMLSHAQARLSIRRLNAEPRHLGLDGWQFEPAWLSPESCHESAGETVLRLGPQIVDHIEELVRVEIGIEGKGVIGQVNWPDITPSAQSITDINLYANPNGRKPLELAEAAAEPERPKQFELDQSIMIGVAQAVFSTPAPDVSAPVAPAPKRRLPIYILLILLAALGALELMRPELLREAYAKAVALLAPAVTNASQEAAPRTETTSPPAPGPSLRAMNERYLAMLTQGGTTTHFLEFGREALRAGHAHVAFRAFEEANPSANEEAAWEIAQFYDPRNTDASYRAVARPDAARAARYHAVWKGRSTRHAAELQALCEQAGREATTNPQLAASCRG